MAVVRILSDDAEYREKLIKDLQGRGFEVEIAMPTENGQDANPQISISECTLEELPQLAASLQQNSGTTSPVSTDAIAFLVPHLLSGVHSLKAFIVRSSVAPSKLEPESVAEAQAASQSVSNEPEESTAFAVPPSPSTEPQSVSHPLKDVPPAPKLKISRKKKEDDFELVPHGLIWQAISEASAVSAQQQSPEIAIPVENLAVLELKDVELSKTKSPEVELPEPEAKLSEPEVELANPEVQLLREDLPETKKELPAMQSQSSSAAPVHSMNSKPARPRSRVPFRAKNSSDRRFWNVAALAVGVAILASLALPHVHRLTPLPGVEAHNAQAESTSSPAASISAPSKVENISRPVAVASPAVKHPANKTADKTNDEKSDQLAKDTVVRFGSKSEETHDVVTKQPQRKTGVRYFSDLD